MFHVKALPEDARAVSSALVASFLTHQAPALRHLVLPGHDWLSSDRRLLALLRPFAELRALHLGASRWMREGTLARYWRDKTPRGSRVQRGAQDGWVTAWGQQVHPSVRAAIREQHDAERDDARLTARMRGQDRLRAATLMGMDWVEQQVDGTRAAQAFFDAIAAASIPAPAPISSWRLTSRHQHARPAV